MIKRLAVLWRRPDLTPAQFRQHWSRQHAQVVLQLPHLVAYSQHVVLGSVSSRPGGMPTPDGIAELWFEEVPGHQAGSDHEVTRLLLADEVLFLSALVGYTVEPVEARHGPASKVWWTGRWCRGEPSPEDLAATDACLDMIRQRADSSGLQRVRMGERPFTRRALASEPLAPQVFFTGGFDGEATAAARAASTTNELERACTGHVESWSTLMCEELCIL